MNGIGGFLESILGRLFGKPLESPLPQDIGNNLRAMSSRMLNPNASSMDVPNIVTPPPPKPDYSALKSKIDQGLSKYSPDQPLPIASMSGQLAEAGSQLGQNDLLPTIMALMETGGGTKSVGNNNPYNIRGIQDNKRQFINYPDLQTSILGGGDQKGFLGTILNSGYYNDFNQSGNLADFFKTFTPQGEGNPSQEELIARYLQLMSYFQ